MAEGFAALEARAEAVTEAMQKAREALLIAADLLRHAITSDDGLDAADAVVGVNTVLSAVRLLESAGAADPHVAPSAETRQPVAWWIGPHDGLMAGATTNKSLADARIEQGATVRPLVFGDVATEAKAVIEAAEYVCDDYDEAEVNSLPTPMRHLWNAVAALYAAKAGGASDGR
jgi:hypothetical protein